MKMRSAAGAVDPGGGPRIGVVCTAPIFCPAGGKSTCPTPVLALRSTAARPLLAGSARNIAHVVAATVVGLSRLQEGPPPLEQAPSNAARSVRAERFPLRFIRLRRVLR